MNEAYGNKARVFDVIIVGAGIVGATCGALLASAGISVAVIDSAAAKPPKRPGALAINLASAQILHMAGAWDNIPKEEQSIFRSIHLWQQNHSASVQLDSRSLCRAYFGHIVSSHALQTSLIERLSALSVSSYATHISAMTSKPGKISVRLANGGVLTAALLVAADGRRSKLREMAGIDFPDLPYHQQAVTCQLQTSLAHKQIARQWFLDSGPLALLPLSAAHECALIWSVSNAQAATLTDLKAEDFCNTIEQASNGILGQITNAGKRERFSLYRGEAQHYASPRLALIGDAAHSVHPLAGQGANIGLLDAASLAQLVSEAHTAQRDLGGWRLLQRYARWRRAANSEMLCTIAGVHDLFHARTEWIQLVRTMGMRALHRLPPVKRLLMERACGLRGDLPALARVPSDPYDSQSMTAYSAR